MYREEELKKLVEEEDSQTEEEILLLLATLHTTLSELENELRVFYQKYGKDGVVTYAEARKWVSSNNHLKRLVFLNQGISDIFESGFNSFEKIFKSHLSSIVRKEAKFFGVKLDVDAILNAPWGADELSALQRLVAYRNKWTQMVNIDLKRSILRQDSIVDVLTGLSKRGNTMDWQFKRLLRSESNAVSSLSRKIIYTELGYERYKFIHVDKCHCEECSSMDGCEFPVSEYVVGVTANPLHPNCLDTTIPIME